MQRNAENAVKELKQSMLQPYYEIYKDMKKKKKKKLFIIFIFMQN